METVRCLHYEWKNKVVMALDIKHHLIAQKVEHKVSLKVIFHVINPDF